ncbi:MAG: hypothetical protein R2695_13085 [Acidimicrobiales bacterium]
MAPSVALDCYVHHHDIAVPLGRSVLGDDARLRCGWPTAWWARGQADRYMPAPPALAQVTDIDWHYGTDRRCGWRLKQLTAGVAAPKQNDLATGDGLRGA